MKRSVRPRLVVLSMTSAERPLGEVEAVADADLARGVHEGVPEAVLGVELAQQEGLDLRARLLLLAREARREDHRVVGDEDVAGAEVLGQVRDRAVLDRPRRHGPRPSGAPSRAARPGTARRARAGSRSRSRRCAASGSETAGWQRAFGPRSGVTAGAAGTGHRAPVSNRAPPNIGALRGGCKASMKLPNTTVTHRAPAGSCRTTSPKLTRASPRPSRRPRARRGRRPRGSAAPRPSASRAASGPAPRYFQQRAVAVRGRRPRSCPRRDRSPGRRLQPATVWCASCCSGLQ